MDDHGVRDGPRGLVHRLQSAERPEFSLCCMLTDWADYGACLESFRAGGFTEDVCEVLVLDNSRGNVADAYTAVNEFLQTARAPRVVLHHQDVRLLEQGVVDLRARLAELDRTDPAWGVCGNAGATASGQLALCLSHPHGEARVTPSRFPTRVVSLDENFLVVRRSANLAVSGDLRGFHHYGPDLCLVADILGYSTYVIDFYLRHNSAGDTGEAYRVSRRLITAKYRRALRHRRLEVVTFQPLFLSGSWLFRVTGPYVRAAQRRLRLLPRHGVPASRSPQH